MRGLIGVKAGHRLVRHRRARVCRGRRRVTWEHAALADGHRLPRGCAHEHGTITATARSVAAPGPSGWQTLLLAWPGSFMCQSTSVTTAGTESVQPLQTSPVKGRRSCRDVPLSQRDGADVRARARQGQGHGCARGRRPTRAWLTVRPDRGCTAASPDPLPISAPQPGGVADRRPPRRRRPKG